MMYRYMFKFSKQGEMRLLSHLDLQRLFHRMFRRIGVDLAHTKGYNPKPRMYIALPLSLGFESVSEYAEFLTEQRFDTDSLADSANAALPKGIRILDARRIELSPKTIPALVEYASYDISIPLGSAPPATGVVESFFLQDSIIVNRRDKKTKKNVPREAKHLITDVQKIEIAGETLNIRTVLCASGSETMNPLQLAEALCAFLGIEYKRETCRIVRLELYGMCRDAVRPLSDCVEPDEW